MIQPKIQIPSVELPDGQSIPVAGYPFNPRGLAYKKVIAHRCLYWIRHRNCLVQKGQRWHFGHQTDRER
jgi:hypothetical protein